MLARPLEACGHAEEAFFINSFYSFDRHELRLSLGQGARLIDNQGVYLFHDLQCFRVLDEHPGGGSPAGPHHDGDRRRQSERAGAGDHQHRHRVYYGVRQAGLGPGEVPDHECNDRDAPDRGDEIARHHVGELLDRGARALRLGHHADDLRKQGVRAHLLRTHHEGAGAVDRGADQPVAPGLFNRDRFARDHGFVHAALTLDHRAVHRYLLSGTHAQPVAGPDLLQGYVLFFAAVADDACALRRKAEEEPDRRVGARARPQLEHLAQENQGRDHRGRLKIDVDRAVLHLHDGGEYLREKQPDDAVDPGDRDPRADQGEHVQVPGDHGLPASHQERPSAPEHHGRCKGELDPLNGAHGESLRQKPRQQVGGHGDQKHGRGQDYADPEPPRHVLKLRVFFLDRDGARLERHAALRTGARLVLDHLRVHGAGVLGFGPGGGKNVQLFQGHAAFRARARLRLPYFGMHGAGVDPAFAAFHGGALFFVKILLRVFFECGQAVLAAEIILRSFMFKMVLGIRGHVHSADRVFFEYVKVHVFFIHFCVSFISF